MSKGATQPAGRQPSQALSPECARSADRGFVWLPTCHPAQEQILPPDPDPNLSFFAREAGRGPPLVVLPARGQAASDLPTRVGGATSVSVPPARTLPVPLGVGVGPRAVISRAIERFWLGI